MPSLHKKSFAAEQLALRKQKKVSPVVWVLVGVVVVVLVVGVYVVYQKSVVQKRVETEEEQIKSVAVLPFEDMSQEKDQEWFCDGIAETILNNLTKIDDLQVIARTSAFSFKGKNITIDEIAHILNVEAILEGSVIKSGNRLQITAQLIKADQGYNLWSETYKRETEDVFPIIEEISLKIVEALKITINADEKTAIEKHPTENLEAFDLYLLGNQYTYLGKHDTALGYFNQAIQKDPDFALAYAGIAHVYNMLGYGGNKPPKETFQKAKEAIGRALELDENLAEAHTEQVWTSLYYDWDWSTAEKSARRAIDLKPNYWWAHHFYRDYLMIMGRWDDAIAETQRAIELDPLGKRTFLLPYTYYLAGRYEEGEKLCLELIALDPDDSFLHNILAGIYIGQGNISEAVELAEKAVDLHRSNYVNFLKAELARAYVLSGEREKAVQILDELLERPNEGSTPSSVIAIVHASLGEMDEAFEWLDKAYEDRESWVVYFKTFPEWEILRSDPRGKEFLKKMGLAED